MSFILDALSKSEQARLQTVAAPSYSLLPTMCEQAPPPRRWPLVLAAGIAFNASALYYWRQQPEMSPPPVVFHSTAQVRAMPEPQASLPDAPSVQAQNADRVARTPDPSVVHAKVSQVQTSQTLQTASGTPASGLSRLNPVGKRAAEEAVPRLPVQPRALERNLVPAVAVQQVSGKVVEREESPGFPERQAPDVSEIPPIAVAGFIRNEGATSMVIVNDKLAREGDEVSAGLTLEKIIGDRVVFNFKGYRFVR